jgi:hypothetical protein
VVYFLQVIGVRFEMNRVETVSKANR